MEETEPSWGVAHTIIRSLAKRATPTAVRIMGIEAVSRKDFDSGISTMNWSFFILFFLFLNLSNSVIFPFRTSDGPSRCWRRCICLRSTRSPCPNPVMANGIFFSFYFSLSKSLQFPNENFSSRPHMYCPYNLVWSVNLLVSPHLK